MTWTVEYPKGRRPKKKRITVFGGFVRMRRTILGIPQKELAKALGYKDPASISSMEHGKVPFSEKHLIKLADLINVNLFQLKGIHNLDIEMRHRQVEREAFK